MKKYAIILTAALFVCAFSGCDEEATLPYIPVEKPDNNTPPEGDDPDTYTVAYRLDKVLLCAPENPNGTDIYGKLDYFPSLRMTLNVSPLATTVTFDNGDIPFVPFPKRCPKAPSSVCWTATSSPTCCGSKVRTRSSPPSTRTVLRPSSNWTANS